MDFEVYFLMNCNKVYWVGACFHSKLYILKWIQENFNMMVDY